MPMYGARCWDVVYCTVCSEMAAGEVEKLKSGYKKTRKGSLQGPVYISYSNVLVSK